MPEPNETRAEVYGNISKYLTLTMEEIKSDMLIRTSIKNPDNMIQKLNKRVYNSKQLPQIKDFTTIRAFDEIYIKNLKSFLYHSQKTIKRFFLKKCHKFGKNIQIR